MTDAIVTYKQILYDKEMSTVTAWDNLQEDPVWLQEFADEQRVIANGFWDQETVLEWTLEYLHIAFIEDDHISYSVNVSFTLGNLQGNVVTGGMPGGNSLLVSTAYTGPGPNRGRIYFMGLPEASQDNGIWEVNVRNVFQTMVLAWRDGVTVQGQNSSLQIARRPSSVFPAYVLHPVQTVSTTRGNRSQRNRNPD